MIVKLIKNLFEYNPNHSLEDLINQLQPTASNHAAELLLGPCLVGWMIGIFTTGLLTCLFISYLIGPLYPQDSTWIRLSCWLVFLTTILSSLLNAMEAYWYAVHQARDFQTLRSFTIPDCLPIIPQAICGLIVQLYLSRRATSVSQSP